MVFHRIWRSVFIAASEVYNGIGRSGYYVCTGGKSGTSGDNHVIDDIHSGLMRYIREQPSTWAPILSSVSDLVVETLLMWFFSDAFYLLLIMVVSTLLFYEREVVLADCEEL